MLHLDIPFTMPSPGVKQNRIAQVHMIPCSSAHCFGSTHCPPPARRVIFMPPVQYFGAPCLPQRHSLPICCTITLGIWLPLPPAAAFDSPLRQMLCAVMPSLRLHQNQARGLPAMAGAAAPGLPPARSPRRHSCDPPSAPRAAFPGAAASPEPGCASLLCATSPAVQEGQYRTLKQWKTLETQGRN